MQPNPSLQPTRPGVGPSLPRLANPAAQEKQRGRGSCAPASVAALSVTPGTGAPVRGNCSINSNVRSTSLVKRRATSVFRSAYQAVAVVRSRFATARRRIRFNASALRGERPRGQHANPLRPRCSRAHQRRGVLFHWPTLVPHRLQFCRDSRAIPQRVALVPLAQGAARLRATVWRLSSQPHRNIGAQLALAAGTVPCAARFGYPSGFLPFARARHRAAEPQGRSVYVMEDMIIDACRWHVEPESPPYRQRALDHFRERYTVLLAFMRSENLLTDQTLGLGVTDWMRFELRRSHLTPEGDELVRACHGTWNPSFGQGSTQRHLVQWRKNLKRLRAARPLSV